MARAVQFCTNRQYVRSRRWFVRMQHAPIQLLGPGFVEMWRQKARLLSSLSRSGVITRAGRTSALSPTREPGSPTPSEPPSGAGGGAEGPAKASRVAVGAAPLPELYPPKVTEPRATSP